MSWKRGFTWLEKFDTFKNIYKHWSIDFDWTLSPNQPTKQKEKNKKKSFDFRITFCGYVVIYRHGVSVKVGDGDWDLPYEKNTRKLERRESGQPSHVAQLYSC